MQMQIWTRIWREGSYPGSKLFEISIWVAIDIGIRDQTGTNTVANTASRWPPREFPYIFTYLSTTHPSTLRKILHTTLHTTGFGFVKLHLDSSDSVNIVDPTGSYTPTNSSLARKKEHRGRPTTRTSSDGAKADNQQSHIHD
ncbi:uncharacterized protein N7487_007606 [Penicillium crustosum]|uniref:uncharacterized protein n=1 Tax=Penicillium crustosum TaxID=36656 RepID=UPI0023A623DC|nr:uncharacterized protein N7487_007606 [Penicillium crustosum]KAJ5401710.1 hypothetical protein N7487_007606 [Penicillium crustosum]